MGLIDGFFKEVQRGVNNIVGDDYREVYFRQYPAQKQNCACCGKTLCRGDSDFTIDHIVPQKYHGTNAITNLQPMCRSCNSRKRHKINGLTVKYSGARLINLIKELNGKKDW